MRRAWRTLAIFTCAGSLSLHAQTPTPARPVDPTQAMPPQPVAPPKLAPDTPLPATGTNTPSSGTIAPATGTNTTSANPPAPAVTLTVLADTSLKKVLQELAQNWADSRPDSPRIPLSLANAGTIRSKMTDGAVWDVVISADLDDVKAMTGQGILLADGQRSLARNTVVIYGRHALIKDDDLEWFDLIGSEWKQVALGNPDSVASGRVAKRALGKHDLYDSNHLKLYTTAPNEERVLGYAEREEADAIFVYKTDLADINLPGFEVYPIKDDEAPPVFYVASVAAKAQNPVLGRAFLDYLTGDSARPIWVKYGFETD
ncbi:MAG TPA: molybdate ABC transporter substrate-binding protein [Candidatus Methylacidiphilales bacterium]|nr:molybdate ABC transporter substrate-binding protein [Candidatus Methylacidiphilales bacterium]